MKKFSTLIGLTIGLSLFCVWGIATAFAAADDYSVSGGIYAGDVVVGTPASLTTITIADAGGDDFGADPETIRVAINTASFPSIVLIPTVSTLTIAGSCGYTGHNALTYAADNTYVDIPVTGGTSCANAELITINGLQIEGMYTQAAPGAPTNLVTVDNRTTSSDNAVATLTTSSCAVSAATTLTATIDVDTVKVVGERTGPVKIAIIFPVNLAQNDTIKLTFPANWDVSTLTTGSGKDYGLDGTVTVGVSGQVVTLTLSGAAQTTLSDTITFEDETITATYVADASNVAILIEQATSEEDIVASAANTGVNKAIAASTVGDLSSCLITPKDMTAAQYNPHTIAFTTVTQIPNLGKIKITYPSGWNVASVNGLTAHTLSGLDGTWTASVSGQVITLTQTNGTATSAGAKSLKLESIKAPQAAGSGGDATILTETADGSDIETTTVSTGTVTAGSNSSSWDSGTSSNTEDEEEEVTAEEETGTTEEGTTEEGATEEETGTTEEGTTEEGATEEEGVAEEPAIEPITVTTESSETVTLEDVTGHWAESEITAMTEQEIVKGNENGDFNPDGKLNRAEAAAILYRVLGLEEPTAPAEAPFSDVAVDAWYAGYVNELKTLELVDGQTETTYAPGADMNRAEFLQLAMNVYHYLTETMAPAEQVITDAFADLDTEAWYAPVVSEAYGLEFIHGSTCTAGTCFNAGDPITRAEATKILYNMFYALLTQ